MSQCAKENDSDIKNKSFSSLQNNAEDVQEEGDNAYNDEETEYYIQQAEKRKDSIFLTKKRMLKEMTRVRKAEDHDAGDKNLFSKVKRNISKTKFLASSSSKHEDPAQMLEERLERSRVTCTDSKDSIFLAKKRLLKVTTEASKPEDDDADNKNLFTKIKRNVGKKKILASSKSKIEALAEMPAERPERGRESCTDSIQQRDVIAFEDELQATVANAFNDSLAS